MYGEGGTRILSSPPWISHCRCTFSSGYEILAGTIGNLFPFDVVQRYQHCYFCVLWEKLECVTRLRHCFSNSVTIFFTDITENLFITQDYQIVVFCLGELNEAVV